MHGEHEKLLSSPCVLVHSLYVFVQIFVNYMVFRRDRRDCYRDSYLFVGTVGTVVSGLLR